MGRKKGKGKGKKDLNQTSESQQQSNEKQTLIMHSNSYNQTQNTVLVQQREEDNNARNIHLVKESPRIETLPSVWGKKRFMSAGQSSSSQSLQLPFEPSSTQGIAVSSQSHLTKSLTKISLNEPNFQSTSLQQSKENSTDYGASGDYGFATPTLKISSRGGTLGRKLKVDTNFLPLCIKPKSDEAIHYDVTFTPDKPKPFIRSAFNKLIQEFFPGRYPAFDGAKNIYSSSPLFESACFNAKVNILIPDSDTEKSCDVFIRFASYVDLSSLSRYMHNGTALQVPQEALQCIDVVLRDILNTSTRFVQVGRSFFTPPVGHVVDLGDGIQLWHGVFTSAVLGWKPYLNIDVVHKGFPTEQTVTKYYQSRRIDLTQTMSHSQMSDCKKFLKGLKVQYMLPNRPQTKRSYKINNLTAQSAKEQTFKTDEGVTLTIEAYYKKYKGYVLQYPNLPCLWVGSSLKNTYVPSELCTILPGQVVLKKLTDNQTKNMIRQAATSTEVRKHKIRHALLQSGLNKEQLALKEFGLTIDDTFEQIDARVLDAPTLEYESGMIAEPKLGVWRAKKFFRGAVMKNWTILKINQRTRDSDIMSFSKQIFDRANALGMEVRPSSYRPATTLKGSQFGMEIDQYFDFAKKNKIDLVFVVMPNAGDTYRQIKQIAELKYGILTQCLKAMTLDRMNMSTIDNILLKVNAKLNGTNHVISQKFLKRPSVLNTPVIIVGADVTHPSPEQTNMPSVVGVAASHDPAAFKYNMCWRLQTPKVEIIEDLEAIMKDHLFTFFVKTRHKPQKILFFRDGVSEGQFKQVLDSELTAIRRACKSLNPDYDPKITMIVVQKRHHTRFFPRYDKDAIGKNLNVPPGTVVDTNITHPTELDFYLVSHQSIQGVARPTKYRRLWDENDMSEDALQELTFYLCHMFSRCTRAVSYPAPTYYAHLAAYRGRVYIDGCPKEQETRQIHEDVQKYRPMFFV